MQRAVLRIINKTGRRTNCKWVGNKIDLERFFIQIVNILDH